MIENEDEGEIQKKCSESSLSSEENIEMINAIVNVVNNAEDNITSNSLQSLIDPLDDSNKSREERVKKTANKLTNTKNDKDDNYNNVFIKFDTIETAVNTVEDPLTNVKEEINDHLCVIDDTDSNDSDEEIIQYLCRSTNSKKSAKHHLKPSAKTRKTTNSKKRTKPKPGNVSPRKRRSKRRKTIVKSYNEQDLMKKHIKDCLLNLYLQN